MQNIARFAKTAGQKAVPVVAGVAATSTNVALADAPREEVLSSRRIYDDWELTEVDKDIVLFKPAEIDEAIGLLCRKPQSAVIEEIDSDSSSEGTVDAILERGLPAGRDDVVDLPLDMQDLMTLASRLLKSPGVQREICSAALSDPEVFSILASKVDLPEYLEATGFAARGLLEGAEGQGSSASSSTAIAEVDTGTTAENTTTESSPLLHLSAKVAEGVEQLGNSVARLGRWMRTKITGDAAAEAAEDCSGAASGAAGQNGKRIDSVLGAAMVIMVAVVALIVLRRPSALRGVFRRARA